MLCRGTVRASVKFCGTWLHVPRRGRMSRIGIAGTRLIRTFRDWLCVPDASILGQRRSGPKPHTGRAFMTQLFSERIWLRHYSVC